MDVEEFLAARGALILPPAIAKGSGATGLTWDRESRKARKHRIHRQRKERVASYADSDWAEDFAELRNQAPGVFL